MTENIGVIWLKYLSQLENKTNTIPKEFLEIPEIAKAISILNESSYTKQELDRYDKFWDIISTFRSYIHDAEHRGEKRAKIKAERRAKLVLAKNLKDLDKLSDDEIASVSGLTIEDVEKI